MEFRTWKTVGVVLAVALSGCTAGPLASKVPATTTGTTTSAKIARAGSLTSAKASAIKSLNLISKLGGAALKVRNNLKTKSVPSASLAPKPAAAKFARFRILDLPGASISASTSITIPASGTIAIKNSDGSDAEDIVVASSSVTAANDGNPNDSLVTTAASISVDTNTGETGSETVADVEDASGSIKGGRIGYTPDATASANGEPAEDIKFDVPPDQVGTGNAASISVTVDTGTEKDTASLKETETPNGDITTEGDVTMPSGATFHIVIVVHADGTRDISCLTGDFTFKVTGVTADGVGTGTLYDGDPNNAASVPIGVITLNKGTQPNTIAFYKADGTLDTPQTFNFLK